jgi:hypothetical protein
MKPFSTFASAAALAFSLAVAAAPAHAGDIDVATSGDPGSVITWTSTGPGAGHIDALGVSTHINFNDALFADGTGTAALLTLHGVTTGVLATSLPNFTQAGLDGYFEFRRTSDNVLLLRGDFTNFWLTGITGDRSGNLTSVGGSLNLTSAVTDLSKIYNDNGIFGFTNVAPHFSISSGALQSFKAANITGSFGGSIPEPATWGLMIMGFGGVGALLRNRRRQAAFA